MGLHSATFPAARLCTQEWEAVINLLRKHLRIPQSRSEPAPLGNVRHRESCHSSTCAYSCLHGQLMHVTFITYLLQTTALHHKRVCLISIEVT